MTSSQLDALATSLCGNYWISLDKHPELIDTVMTHIEFSHISQRYPYSLSIYFHCEGSPSGVSIFASIDISQKDLIYSKLDALTLAINNVATN